MASSSHFARFAHQGPIPESATSPSANEKSMNPSQNGAAASYQTKPTTTKPKTTKPTTTISAAARLAAGRVQQAEQTQQYAQSPTPHVTPFDKREAEDELSSILRKPEAPHLRRLRIFQSLAANTSGTPKLESKTISSPENLTDYELKECYDIARAAMAAQFPHRQCNPAMMEDFLKGVFEDWNALDEPPIIHELKDFPFTNQGAQSKIVIGNMKLDRETVAIHHWFGLSVDNEVSVKIEVVRPAKPGARSRVTINPEELRKITWKDDATIEASKKSLQKQALNTLVNQMADYNRNRAVRYARVMLHHQAQGTGTPAPCSSRYDFAELDSALNVMPLLEKSELEQGDQTVILFSKAELGAAFEGRFALKGKKTVKTSTG